MALVEDFIDVDMGDDQWCTKQRSRYTVT
jgi:hypothetical protein